MGIPLQCHLHTHSFHITLIREITWKEDGEEKEREVESKEEKIVDVNQQQYQR